MCFMSMIEYCNCNGNLIVVTMVNLFNNMKFSWGDKFPLFICQNISNIAVSLYIPNICSLFKLLLGLELLGKYWMDFIDFGSKS